MCGSGATEVGGALARLLFGPRRFAPVPQPPDQRLGFGREVREHALDLTLEPGAALRFAARKLRIQARVLFGRGLPLAFERALQRFGLVERGLELLQVIA